MVASGVVYRKNQHVGCRMVGYNGCQFTPKIFFVD